MANFRIYNETLCPYLWDAAKHLDPKVRANLLQMAYDFYEKTKFPAPIIDVYFMGSAANYNWNAESDVDVHVIIDYTKLQMPPEAATKAVKTAAQQWNAEHNVIVKGHKVEMNLQNFAEQKPYVTGIYSLVKDQWIRKPFKMPLRIDRNVLKIQYGAMKGYVQNALNSKDREKMKAAKKYLDAYRQYGLDTYGELSYENLVFKILRSRGLIKQLKDGIVSVYDQEMSVPESKLTEELFDHVPDANVPYLIIGVTNSNGESASGVTLGGGGHGSLSMHTDFDFTDTIAWRYKSKFNVIYMDVRHTPWWKTILPSLRDYLKEKYSLDHVSVSTDVDKYVGRGHSVHEVGYRDVKAHLPDLDDMDYWGKFDSHGVANLDKLTMDNLKALRDKAARFVVGYQSKGKPQWAELHKADYIKYDNELKRRIAGINKPITESPLMTKKGATALAGDKPLKKQNVEKVTGNIVVIRQGTEGGFLAVGWTLVYFMDSDESAQAMKEGKIPYLIVPRGTFMSGGSPITDIWLKKFQKPGTEHILGIIEGHSDDKTIYIEMISVRPGWKRNHIAKLMMDRLKKSFPEAKLTTSTQTDDGQKLFKSYGGEQEKTNEGFGSGIPEKDRLKIKNTDGSTRRWQVRSKDAPKTPKMTAEIVKAIPESDFEEGQPLPPMK